MDFETQLAGFSPAKDLANWVSANFSHIQQTLTTRESELHLSKTELKLRDAELKAAQLKIQALTLELAHHRRVRFGHKNEALSPEQRDLFQETLDTDHGAIEAEIEQAAPAVRAKRVPTGRQPLPEHLPRIEQRHEPESCTCGQCGRALVKIGEDVSEQLDVEPARFFVLRHIRPQYACRACETVTAAPIPAAVIDGGLAAPGLLAWVTTQKYLDHLPLYRIEKISQRQGVGIARSTLAEWVGRVGVALQPLADRLAELLKQRSVLHADETPVAQLDPGKGKTHRAYLWTYRSNDLDSAPPIVVFDYQPGRSGRHVQDFLADWRGDLMVDDYAGYKALFREGVTELACLAHARRKFFEIDAANPHSMCRAALARIAELYAIEQQARDWDAVVRADLRQREAQPKLAALRAWMIECRLAVADGSGMARALDYSLKRWSAIERYAQDGLRPIDNNPVENAIRPIALGRKNWLFAGSERAGKRAAAIQSLLATAKLNGIEPYAWLKQTIEQLPAWPNSRIDELLPLRVSV